MKFVGAGMVSYCPPLFVYSGGPLQQLTNILYHPGPTINIHTWDKVSIRVPSLAYFTFFSQNYVLSRAVDPDPHGSALLFPTQDPEPHSECRSGSRGENLKNNKI